MATEQDTFRGRGDTTETDRVLEWRLQEEERKIRRNRLYALVALVLSAILVIAVAALITSLMALSRDVEAVAKATPKDGSVGTAALKDVAVTAAKLAPGSVTRAAIAPRSITAAQVAPNSITGASIDESTLRGVRRAVNARQASNATALGGLPAASYVSGLTTVQTASVADNQAVKGPVAARCPAGTEILGGGAAVDGAQHGVAIVRSAPNGAAEWVAVAAQYESAVQPWRLVVTAICARDG